MRKRRFMNSFNPWVFKKSGSERKKMKGKGKKWFGAEKMVMYRKFYKFTRRVPFHHSICERSELS
jgi:hypothetical protein